MSLGPIMLDIAGTHLTPDDVRRLQHPSTGGVILFSRNFESVEQLTELTREIHGLRRPPLLIAVDHEGGRVQRFKSGFTRIPPMRELGKIWETHPSNSRRLAKLAGFVLAAELRACGVDFSFAPVLDIDYGKSAVIGNRAFHADPAVISELAHQLMQGLKEAGMSAVGKHFPGHGFADADSHVAIPVDERGFSEISEGDLVPFRKMAQWGLAGVMPAHVIYPKVDSRPAGFSRIWLGKVLRGELGFEGAIFSDDLSMEGASVAGNVTDRAMAALGAGCDMVLVCNRPDFADELLATLKWEMPALAVSRLARMHGRPHPKSFTELREDPHYAQATREVARIGVRDGELAL